MSLISAYAAHAAGFQLGRAVLRLGVDSTGLVTGLRTAENRVQKYGGIAATAGRAAGLALSAPLFAAGVLAAKVGAEYEHTMRRVEAVSGATGKQMDALKRQTVDLAETTRYTMRQVGDAQVFLAMAGLDVTTILKAMPSVLNLAAASGLELARVSDLLTNIMTAFQVSAEKSVEIMDTLTITFTGSNTSMEQLADALRYVAPSVASLGHTVSETAAALGILGNQGIQASLAGTYLRAVFRELARPTGHLKKTIEDLGLSTRNMAGEIVNAAEMVEEFERVGADAADAARGFGRRGGTGAAALVASGSEELRRMQSLHRLALTSTKEIADTMLDTLLGDLAVLRAKFETFLKRVSNGLGPMVRGFIQSLQGLFDYLNSISDRTLNFFMGWGAALVLIPPVIAVIGSGLRGLSRLSQALVASSARFAGAMKSAAGVATTARTAAAADVFAAYRGKDGRFVAAPPTARDARGRFVKGGATQKVAETVTRTTKSLTLMQRAGTAAFGAIAVAARGLGAVLLHPVTGVFTLLMLISAWGARRSADKFRNLEISAMSYADVLAEIVRLEKVVAEQQERQAVPSMPPSTYGPTYGPDPSWWPTREEKELGLLRGRERVAHRETYEKELQTYKELSDAIRRARADVSKGEISFEQYLSDLRVVAQEAEKLLTEGIVFPDAVIGNLIARTEETRKRAEAELSLFWGSMQEVSRNITGLQESILRNDITRDEGEAILAGATAQLDRLMAAMDPEAAEFFAGWMGTLRGRLAEVADEVRDLTREVMKLAESYLETTRLSQRDMLINVRALPLPGELPSGEFTGVQLSNTLPGVDEVNRIANENAEAYFAAHRAALRSAANRQAMQSMFSDFGTDLGARFARAIVSGAETLREDFRLALTAEAMQRAFTAAGDFLGKTLAAQVSKVMSASQAGWVATLIGAVGAVVGIGNRQARASQEAQEAQRAEYAARTEEYLEIYRQLNEANQALLKALSGTLEEHMEKAVELLEEQEEQAAETAAALAELRSEFSGLAYDAMEAERALKDLQEFVEANFGPETAAHFDWMFGAIESLGDLRENLAFVNELQSGISGLLPASGVDRLLETGDIDNTLMGQFMAAGGDADMLRRLGAAISRLREFEAAVADFRDTGEASDFLRDSLHDLAGVDMTALLAQMDALRAQMDAVKGHISTVDSLRGAIAGLRPERGLDLFRSTGRVDEGLRQELAAAGVDMSLVENLGSALADLHAFEEGLSGGASELDALADAANATAAALLGDLRSGLEDFLPGNVSPNHLSAFFELGELSAAVLEQLVSAGADRSLLMAFSEAREQMVTFQRAAREERWRDEFAFEAREYELVRAQESAARDLYMTLEAVTGDLSGHSEAQRLALESAVSAAADALDIALLDLGETLDRDLADLGETLGGLEVTLEEAITKAAEALHAGVEQAALALSEALAALAESLGDQIMSLEEAIRELIEALGNFAFGDGELPGIDGRSANRQRAIDRGYADEEGFVTDKGFEAMREYTSCIAAGGTPIVDVEAGTITCRMPPRPPAPPAPPAPPTVPADLAGGAGSAGGTSTGERPGIAVSVDINVDAANSNADAIVTSIRDAVETNRAGLRDRIRSVF